MKWLSAAMSPRGQGLLEFAAWGTLIVAILASAPFLFDRVGRGIGWIIGLFPHPDELWKECPWCL
jgi:hypothetical protein